MYKIPTTNSKNSGHCQLVRPLERILEEAHLSGELKLNNRKLKDFPKSAIKYNLADTVQADLSRNKFIEWPDEITSFAFLESLLLYHNTIRNIPSTICGLTSLSYLDLRSNQLIQLPREICFLPLQVLLISNNRLVQLPDELGRMEKLTDLDASCNQITNLPVRIGDLRNLRSLSLRSNQLVYFPREITLLTLISLDISNNKISSLPVDVRQMQTLVTFNLDNNPLTFPPANLCIRGLVHVFKFLDTQANKIERNKNGGGGGGGGSGSSNNVVSSLLNSNSHDYSTLKRNSSKQLSSNNNSGSIDLHIDSIYSIKNNNNNGSINRTLDKNTVLNISNHRRNELQEQQKQQQQQHQQQPKEFASQENFQIDSSLDYERPIQQLQTTTTTMSTSSSATASPVHHNQIIDNMNEHFSSSISISKNNGGSSSTINQDDDYLLIDDSQQIKFSGGGGEKNKNYENVQTYKEYKEALKQQRNQDISNFYKNKIKKNSTTTPANAGSSNSDAGQVYCERNQMKSNLTNGNQQIDEILSSQMNNGNSVSVSAQQQLQNTTTSPLNNSCSNLLIQQQRKLSNELIYNNSNKKPIQKVIPQSQNDVDDKQQQQQINEKTKTLSDYLKPQSPVKPIIENNLREFMTNNKIGTGININSSSTATTTAPSSVTASSASASNFTTKIRRNVTWNEAIPSDKLSFTMRREFDRQKEETELLSKLRQIIEQRLKMQLPDDISTALMDGVILCHLANIVRPRSVASIHVPSPGVPHLTMARCRRNVDNFLDACRKIGIDENLICCSADVLEGKQAVQVAITVGELFRLHSTGVGGSGAGSVSGGYYHYNTTNTDNIKSPMKINRCNSSTT